jgi:hypothetical protein
VLTFNSLIVVTLPKAVVLSEIKPSDTKKTIEIEMILPILFMIMIMLLLVGS